MELHWGAFLFACFVVIWVVYILGSYVVLDEFCRVGSHFVSDVFCVNGILGDGGLYFMDALRLFCLLFMV